MFLSSPSRSLSAFPSVSATLLPGASLHPAVPAGHPSAPAVPVRSPSPHPSPRGLLTGQDPMSLVPPVSWRRAAAPRRRGDERQTASLEASQWGKVFGAPQPIKGSSSSILISLRRGPAVGSAWGRGFPEEIKAQASVKGAGTWREARKRREARKDRGGGGRLCGREQGWKLLPEPGQSPGKNKLLDKARQQPWGPPAPRHVPKHQNPASRRSESSTTAWAQHPAARDLPTEQQQQEKYGENRAPSKCVQLGHPGRKREGNEDVQRRSAYRSSTPRWALWR